MRPKSPECTSRDGGDGRTVWGSADVSSHAGTVSPHASDQTILVVCSRLEDTFLRTLYLLHIGEARKVSGFRYDVVDVTVGGIESSGSPAIVEKKSKRNRKVAKGDKAAAIYRISLCFITLLDLSKAHKDRSNPVHPLPRTSSRVVSGSHVTIFSRPRSSQSKTLKTTLPVFPPPPLLSVPKPTLCVQNPLSLIVSPDQSIHPLFSPCWEDREQTQRINKKRPLCPKFM